MKRFWDKVSVAGPNDCWEWQGGLTCGYGMFSHKGKSVRATRFAYELHYGEIPDGKIICHKCDNKTCVNPLHLYDGTPLDNAKDREARGRGNHPSGESHFKAKLSHEEVRWMRALSHHGCVKLGKLFGVNKNVASNILNYKTYREA